MVGDNLLKALAALTLPLLLGPLAEVARHDPVITMPKTTVGTPLIAEDFATSESGQNFELIAGGTWRASQYAYILTDPVAPAARVPNSNLVVNRTALSGNWELRVRMSASLSRSGVNGFSVILGFASVRDYLYANFSQTTLRGTNGVFEVSQRSRRKLASFTATLADLIPKRNYDIEIIKFGTIYEVVDDRVTVATFRTRSLARRGRIGFGSQGSQVTARDLEVSTVTVLDHPTHNLAGSGASPSAAAPTPSPSQTAPTTSAGGLASFFGSDFDASDAFCLFNEQVVSITGSVLTVYYPAGSTAPSMGAPFGGAQICEPFAAGPQTSATLNYAVRFPVGFQFVKGGKLPGLYGGVEPFSGGRHNGDGWSMRLMWRPAGAGEIYAYLAGTTGYGLQLGLGDFYWPADGLWHTVSLHVVVNTPGESNGVAVLSLDGKVVINSTGLDITQTATPISGLFFSSFYGGHDPSWAPTALMHLDFADFSAN
jgi:hypothetical protein